MGQEMPSIKNEMDKLDKQEEERKKAEASSAFFEAFLGGFDRLPRKDQETILSQIDPSRPWLRKEDV